MGNVYYKPCDNYINNKCNSTKIIKFNGSKRGEITGVKAIYLKIERGTCKYYTCLCESCYLKQPDKNKYEFHAEGIEFKNTTF